MIGLHAVSDHFEQEMPGQVVGRRTPEQRPPPLPQHHEVETAQVRDLNLNGFQARGGRANFDARHERQSAEGAAGARSVPPLPLMR